MQGPVVRPSKSYLCTVPTQTPAPYLLPWYMSQPKSDPTPNVQDSYTPNNYNTKLRSYHVPSIDELDIRADSLGGDRVLLPRDTVVARCAETFEEEDDDALSFCLTVFSVLLSRAFFLSRARFSCSSLLFPISAFFAARIYVRTIARTRAG